jgi:hypothetical protein
MNNSLFTNPRFWRGFTFWGFFILFLVLFRSDLVPAARGWMDLIAILFRRKLSPFDASLAPSMLRIGVNVAVYIAIFLISTFVVAQFVLPVQSWIERWAAFNRLVFYWIKWFRGPAVFVHSGKLVSRVGEDDNTNPGVAVVDLRSAIVLEQEYPYLGEPEDLQEQPTLEKEPDSDRYGGLFRSLKLFRREEEENRVARALGPGIHFTNLGEKIRTVVDLRRQVRLAMGETVKTPDGKEYKRPGVNAFTRDGIEVGANCYVVFSLADPPDVIPVAYWGGTEAKHLHEMEFDKGGNVLKKIHPLDPSDAEEIHQAVLSARIVSSSAVPSSSGTGATIYPFDENRVFAAAFGQAYSVFLNKKFQWHELPLVIAADIFRNLLEKYNFDYLYSVDEPNRLPWMEEFKPEFSRRVRNEGLLSYHLIRPAGLSRRESVFWNIPINHLEMEMKKGISLDALEYSASYPFMTSKPLRDRGIKVIVAGFSELKIPLEIREKVAERWRARWDREIQIALARQEREVMQIISSARNQAQRDNAYFLSNLFKEENSTEALALLLFQSLELAATDLKNHKELPPKEILAMLQNLHNWFLREKQEMDDRKRHHKEKGHPYGDGQSPVS